MNKLKRLMSLSLLAGSLMAYNNGLLLAGAPSEVDPIDAGGPHLISASGFTDKNAVMNKLNENVKNWGDSNCQSGLYNTTEPNVIVTERTVPDPSNPLGNLIVTFYYISTFVTCN